MVSPIPPTSKLALYAVLAVVSSFFALVFLSQIYAWTDEISVSHQAENWPTVQGSVISSRSFKNCGKGQRSFFYPSVKYYYQVENHLYVGDEIAIGVRECGTEDEIRAITAPYPVGRPVKVWFNPKNPTEAYLVTGKVSLNTLQNLYSAKITVAISALMAVIFIYLTRRQFQ